MSVNEYVEGTCYYCGNPVFTDDYYLYVNPYTLEQYLDEPRWDYAEITHDDCIPEDKDA